MPFVVWQDEHLVSRDSARDFVGQFPETRCTERLLSAAKSQLNADVKEKVSDFVEVKVSRTFLVLPH